MAEKAYLIQEGGGKIVLEDMNGAILLEASGTGEVGATGTFTSFFVVLPRRRRYNTAHM